jgi:hypothetical protein
MDVARAMEQVLLIAGWWLALSVAASVAFFPLLRSASRGDAAFEQESAAASTDRESASGSIDRESASGSIEGEAAPARLDRESGP